LTPVVIKRSGPRVRDERGNEFAEIADRDIETSNLGHP
jgi:hypothetical protein